MINAVKLIIKPTNTYKLQPSEYPGIQQAADEASNRAQNNYVTLMRVNLILGVAGAAVTIYNFEQAEPKWIVYLLSMLILLSALAFTIAIKYFKFEDLWYQGRALAESTKTVTWRYITGSENYETSLPHHLAENFFIAELKVLSGTFPNLISFMKVGLLNKDAISFEMSRVRSLGWQQRQQIYLNDRITDQINWYSTNALKNKVKKRTWLWVVIGSQIISVIACGSLLIWPDIAWNFVGLLTTIASSAIAWLELRQYQALIQAYQTAVIELTQIKALSTSLNTEDQFTRYVLDSENAISREHTMWLAQRRS